jgi:hypothetical protein
MTPLACDTLANYLKRFDRRALSDAALIQYSLPFATTKSYRLSNLKYLYHRAFMGIVQFDATELSNQRGKSA